jgi:hypothetical protein
VCVCEREREREIWPEDGSELQKKQMGISVDASLCSFGFHNHSRRWYVFSSHLPTYVVDSWFPFFSVKVQITSAISFSPLICG